MKCSKCNTDIYLQCADSEPKRISGEPVCRDCYFEELGNMMEQHPPGFYKLIIKPDGNFEREYYHKV
jgi:hypothetical protein